MDMVVSAKKNCTTHIMFFLGTSCFKGTISQQVQEGIKLFQVPLRHVVYALPEPFEKEVEHLQEQQIIMPLLMRQLNGVTVSW